MRKLVLALMIGSICAGPAIVGGTRAEADQHLTPKIINFGFSPDDITVRAGDKVTWTNTSDRPHTVSDRGGTFDTGPIAPEATGEVTFSVPGRYFFFCRINPGTMNGVLVVEPGDAAPSAVRVQAVDPAREGEALSFDPNSLEVAAGTPVTLANVGGKPHTLTADDGSFDTGIVNPGASGGKFAGTNATVVPNEPGSFPFHCEVHPEAMKGVLTVTGNAREGPASKSDAPSSRSIDIVDFAFEPDEASVAPGGAVTWNNTGEAPHTATLFELPSGDSPVGDTGTIDPGGEGSFNAPSQPGSYAYRCTIHPGRMRGTLVVVGAGAADPTGADPYKEASAGGGPGGGVSMLALGTGVGGAFLGGMGVAAFLTSRASRRKSSA